MLRASTSFLKVRFSTGIFNPLLSFGFSSLLVCIKVSAPPPHRPGIGATHDTPACQVATSCTDQRGIRTTDRRALT